MRRLFGFSKPGRGVEEKPVLHLLRAFAQTFGEGGQQLGFRTRHDRAEAEIGSRPRKAGEKQSVGFFRRQAVQTGAVTVQQPVAALRSPFAVDRDAGLAQGIDVSVDGAFGDFEFVGKHSGGDPAFRCSVRRMERRRLARMKKL